LLRPAENQAKISVYCENPLHMKLVWAQKAKENGEILYEKLPKRHSEEYVEPAIYYLRNQQVLFLRMLLFDKLKRLFYNYSCYESELSSSNDIGKVAKIEPYYMSTVELIRKA
jgi:hypothetical protein